MNAKRGTQSDVFATVHFLPADATRACRPATTQTSGRTSSGKSSFLGSIYSDTSDAAAATRQDLATRVGQRLLQRYGVLGLAEPLPVLNDLAQAAATVASSPGSTILCAFFTSSTSREDRKLSPDWTLTLALREPAQAVRLHEA